MTSDELNDCLIRCFEIPRNSVVAVNKMGMTSSIIIPLSCIIVQPRNFKVTSLNCSCTGTFGFLKRKTKSAPRGLVKVPHFSFLTRSKRNCESNLNKFSSQMSDE